MSRDYSKMANLPEFDEVTQLQIDEFATAIGGATDANLVVVIVQTTKALQCAMHSRGPDEAVSRMELIEAMCMVAGGALSEATKGAFTLLVRQPDGTMEAACPSHAHTVSGKRPS